MTPTFSKLTDFFGASSAALKLISSRAGYARQVQETAGICVINARDLSGDFLNPVCQYVVAANLTLSFVLGRAYTHNGLGFMLTSVSVHSAVCSFPVVTLTGTANEGADAIKTHAVSVNIRARSKAQDVAGAFGYSGCHLNECEATWSAEPVVIVQPVELSGGEKIAKPVASDIQHGRVEVTAKTVLGAPTVANGWDLIVTPDPNGADAIYEIHSATATKSLT